MSKKKWDVVSIAPDLLRVDVYEESLGDEWRGAVLLDAEEAKRFATDLAVAAKHVENMKLEKKR